MRTAFFSEVVIIHVQHLNYTKKYSGRTFYNLQITKISQFGKLFQNEKKSDFWLTLCTEFEPEKTKVANWPPNTIFQDFSKRLTQNSGSVALPHMLQSTFPNALDQLGKIRIKIFFWIFFSFFNWNGLGA